MFSRTRSDTLLVSDEPEELIRDGFTWPQPFVLKNEMLRNHVIENLDKRLPSARADRTDILGSFLDERMKYTLQVVLLLFLIYL